MDISLIVQEEQKGGTYEEQNGTEPIRACADLKLPDFPYCINFI